MKLSARAKHLPFFIRCLPRTFSAVLVPAVLCLSAGCSTMQSAMLYLTAPSEEEIYADITPLKEEQDKLAAVKNDSFKETWVQPKNKRQQCRIWTSSDNDAFSANDFYWDGACKEGYAYGLGSVFYRNDNNLLIRQITEYRQPGQSPFIYYITQPGSELGLTGVLKDNSGYAAVHSLEAAPEGDKYISQTNFAYVVNPSTMYAANAQTLQPLQRYGKFYSNYRLICEVSTDPYSPGEYSCNYHRFNEATKNNEPIGYGILKLRNRSDLLGVDVRNPSAGPQEVALPDEYKNAMQAEFNEIRGMLNDSSISTPQKIAQDKIAQYTAKICKVKAPKPFSDWPEYKDICGEADVLASAVKNANMMHAEMTAKIEKQHQMAQLAQMQAQAAQQQLAASIMQGLNAASQQINYQQALQAQQNQNFYNTLQMINNMNSSSTVVNPQLYQQRRARITQCHVGSSWTNCYTH